MLPYLDAMHVPSLGDVLCRRRATLFPTVAAAVGLTDLVDL